ncbi:MAG: site-2 protease family protein [Candidatus Woesebacteria bacterium]|nr:MAG: site-2 protease family protein [Candidatus Woesebacteria bacterium]
MLISILVFLVVLSVLILVHELGHFIMARRAGIWVEEFGFGLPPRLFGKKIGETIYSVNALPFGGFVRLHGEQEEGGVTDPNRAFLNKNKRTRISVVVAGVVMNFLLAVVAFAIVYSVTGIPKDTHQIKVVDISANSPAISAGLVVGDIIRKVDGKDVADVNNFIKNVDAKKGQKVNIETEKGKITVIPRVNPPAGEGPLGVTITSTEIYFPPVWQRPFYGIYYGFKDAIFWGQTILVGLLGIIAGLFKGHAPQDVSGPVGIFAVTTEAAKNGIITLINFVGVLSVNLAILNILPFPALDGGRLFFIGIESIIGKKIVPKVEAIVHTIGMVILLTLILAITIGDIRRLITAGSIDGFLKSIVR